MSTSSYASHVSSAEITYKHIIGNEYDITLKLYRDCSGIQAPTSPSIQAFSTSCGQLTNLTLVQKSFREVSSLCSSLLPSSSCNGGSLFGIEEHIYSIRFTLPVACSDWKFSYQVCCRNGVITNSQNTNVYDLYVETTLDNTIGPNNSPQLLNHPFFSACSGVPISYSPSVIDDDGDSLVFQLINPLDATAVNIPYVVPFTPTYPIATSPPNSFGFDTATGMMNFTPSGSQMGIIAMRVDEYRNGQKIGSVMRDYQLTIQSGCTNTNVQVAPPNIGSGGTLTGNEIKTCSGQMLSFSILASDADINDTLTLISNVSDLPGASITVTGTNPIVVVFNWSVPINATGTYPLKISITDDACPIKSEESILLIISINGIVAGLADSTICTGSTQSIQLNSQLISLNGNGTYQWSPATGLSNPSIANPVATVSSPITYTVTYTENGCTVSDFVNIIYNGSFSVNPSSDTICAGASTQLNAVFQGTYQPSCGISSNGCNGPQSNVQIGTDVTATGPNGTSNEAGSPFMGFYHDGKWQAIYKASELNALGLTEGLLTSMALELSNVLSTMPYSDFTISLACTQDTFDLNTPYFLPNTATVYNSAFSPVVGWNTFTFSNQYYWNGIDDLLIQICYDNSTFSNYDHVYYTETNNISVIYSRVDWEFGCTINYNIQTTNRRPNLRLTSCPENFASISWTPTAGLDNPMIGDPIASPNTTTTYVATVNNDGCTYQDSVLIVVNQLINASLNVTNPTCTTSGSITVTANGGAMPYSYAWSDATIGNTTTATGLTGGTYTVTVTDNEGCAAIATSTLPAANSTAPTGLVISNPGACAGDTISLTATGGSPGTGASLVYYENSCGGALIADPNQVIVSGAANYFVRYEGPCGVTSCASTSVNCFAGYIVEASVLLEGPYQTSSSLMVDDLRVGGLLPFSEPFTGLGFLHLNGGGNESTVAAVFSATGPNAIVDWVFVELRQAADDTTPFATRSALLQADGDIVDMDGVSGVDFAGSTVTSGNYWVVIRHRSHVRIMSASLVNIDGVTPGVYDFNSQGAYGNGIKTLLNGDKVMYEGDLNQDGAVNSADRSMIWNARNQTGYLVEDSTLDGFCMADDRSQNWNNKNVSTQVP